MLIVILINYLQIPNHYGFQGLSMPKCLLGIENFTANCHLFDGV